MSIQPALATISADIMEKVCEALPTRDLYCFRIAFPKRPVIDSSLSVILRRKIVVLTFSMPKLSDGLQLNRTAIKATFQALRLYFKSGHNARQRIQKVESEPKVINCLPRGCLEEYAAREASSQELISAAREGLQSQVEKELAEDQVWVNAADSMGLTPLYWALHHKETQLAQLLLQNGANPHLAGRVGIPILSLVKDGADDIAHLLIDAGADDLDVPDNNGDTPLFWAIYLAKFRLAIALIKAGAVELNPSEIEDPQYRTNARILENLLVKKPLPAGFTENPLIVNRIG
jgi:hypothetical protein